MRRTSFAEIMVLGMGQYPVEYNPKIHGPYDPARYYGKGKYSWFEARVIGPTAVRSPMP